MDGVLDFATDRKTEPMFQLMAFMWDTKLVGKSCSQVVDILPGSSSKFLRFKKL